MRASVRHTYARFEIAAELRAARIGFTPTALFILVNSCHHQVVNAGEKAKLALLKRFADIPGKV